VFKQSKRGESTRIHVGNKRKFTSYIGPCPAVSYSGREKKKDEKAITLHGIVKVRVNTRIVGVPNAKEKKHMEKQKKRRGT